MKRSEKLAPLPAPTPAEASQSVPLVQTIERPPVPPTAAPVVVLMLPKLIGLVETVQFLVTVALTLSEDEAVSAIAAVGMKAAAEASSKVAAR
jgi:hypothetical protein